MSLLVMQILFSILLLAFIVLITFQLYNIRSLVGEQKENAICDFKHMLPIYGFGMGLVLTIWFVIFL